MLRYRSVCVRVLKVRRDSEDVKSRPLRSIIALALERRVCSFAAWWRARVHAHACVMPDEKTQQCGRFPLHSASWYSSPAYFLCSGWLCKCMRACEEQRGGKEERQACSVVEWRVEHAGGRERCAPSAARAAWAASARVSALPPEEEVEEMTLPHLYLMLLLLLLSCGPRLAPLRSVISWTSPASEVGYDR